MRVRECSWPPSLVVEWLCRQLEQRGIPGTLYAHTVLSLLHSHYCLHSVAHYTASASEQGLVVGTPPAVALLEHCASLLQDHHTHQCEACRHAHAGTHGAASDATAASLKQHDRSSRLLLGDAGLLKGALLLEEEEELILGQSLHPDADLPLVPRNPKTPNKTKPEHKQACCCESSSRRARKRHKKQLQQELSLECFSPERLQKLTALQCLLSASDQEPSDLESLLEELCRRLKASVDGGADGTPLPPSPPPPPPPVTHNTDKFAILKKGSKAACGDEPAEQTASDAQRYFAAFPALPRDPESGPSTSSLSASPVADCAWGCKDTCGHDGGTPTLDQDRHTPDKDAPIHGQDASTSDDDAPTRGQDAPTQLHAATCNADETKPLRANDNKHLTNCEEAATFPCDSKCTGILHANNNEVTSEASSDIRFTTNSAFQNTSCLIVDQDPRSISFHEHKFTRSEKEKCRNNSCSEGSKENHNAETTLIRNSSDELLKALNTSISPRLSGSEELVGDSCIDTPTLFVPVVGENSELFSITPSVDSVETPIVSELIELPADDDADSLALVASTAPELLNNSLTYGQSSQENQLAIYQPLFEHLDESNPIEPDLDLDILVTTSGAPFRTRLSDSFTDSLTPCKLYSIAPNSSQRNSVSHTHSLIDLQSLTNLASDINKTSALDLSVLRNLDDQETSPKSEYSIWDSAFSPLVKQSGKTLPSQFNWKNKVPECPELSEINDLEKFISGCAENTNDDDIVSICNASTLQNYHISPSDLKRKQTLPFVPKHISPSDLKSKQKLSFSNHESLCSHVEDEDLISHRFEDRIVSEQAQTQLTAGHGMERSDQMSSLVSGQRGVMPQPQYQSYASHQISFGDIEPPTALEEQQHTLHHYTGEDASHNTPDVDLNVLSLIEAQSVQRSAAGTFIVTTSVGGNAVGGHCIDTITANPRAKEGNVPSSSSSMHSSIMFHHQPHPAPPLSAAGPLPRPAHADPGSAPSHGVAFSLEFGGVYDGRQVGVDGPVEAGYVGDISSRESSEDREDYDEALADDEDEEGDHRHGAARRHQPEEDKRRRLSEKRRTRLSSQSCSHKQDGQLNALAAYRGGVPLPPPPPSSMLSSQEQMQLEQKFIEDQERNFFERRQQEFQQQQQLEHLKHMNFLQEQLLFMQQQQESLQPVFTSTSQSGNMTGSNSQTGNPLYRTPGEDPNLWDQNLSEMDSNVKHTLAQYLDILNQPNSKASLLAPSDTFSPSTENNRTSSTGISDYLLKSLMESPGFGPRKVDGGGESFIRRSVSNDQQDAWVDQNANSLSSSVVSAPLASLVNFQPQNEFNSSAIGVGCDNNEDEEKSLCKTFQSLGLERIWDSDAATSANDEYGLARQQMLQAGSLYHLSDQFMHQQHQPQHLHLQQLQPRNNSEARVWPTALQSHAQMQRSDPGPASSSIVNPTFLRLSSGPSEPEKDLSCYTLSDLQLFSSAVCGDGPPQQSMQKQAVHRDQGLPSSIADGMELRGASVSSSVSGPGGVQAVLHRSMQSNFSSVVPRKTNVQGGPDYLKPSTFADVPTSVEENLLTSPRTHFRPIKLHDETTANGTLTTFTATSTHVPLSLPYQRSNSGTLYLEKDAIDGSPKKYMIYKDPTDKTIEHRPLYMPNQESSLVPKFKVVKNEKFCQTDGTNHDFDLGPPSLAVSSSRMTPSPESDDDYDVFAFQKNDLASLGAFQRNNPSTQDVFHRNDPTSHGALQRNELPSHGPFHRSDLKPNAVFQRNDQAYSATFLKSNQASHGTFDKIDQVSHSVIQTDRASHDAFQNNLASQDPIQKIDQSSRGTFTNCNQTSNNSSIIDCWADNAVKEDGWKSYNLNNNLMNNRSKWVANADDAEQMDLVRAAQPIGRGNSDPRAFQAQEEVKQSLNKTNEASPTKSFCRNLLGPVLDSNTPTSVGQLVDGQSGRKDRVIDTPAARAIWSSNPSTSVSGQQSHQAVIAAQHIDSAIKALWANSPDDKLRLAAAAAAAYYSDNNRKGDEEAATLPAWTMKSSATGGIEQHIPTEWLEEQSILYTAEEEERGGGDEGSCAIDFPEHLSNYYPQDEAWSSGDDCAPGNTDDFVRGIWSKVKRDSWNSNGDGGWQKEALLKTENEQNWNDEPGRNLNQKREIWKKEGPEDWGNHDDSWHGGNISKWSDGEERGHPQTRGELLEGLHKYSETRWSRTDPPSKQTVSGGGDGAWPVLSTKDHLDDLALLAEAQNWEKAVNLSASDCTVSGTNQQQQSSNKTGHLQEDLEELDPGWQLQEGFVWDPHTGNTPRKIPPLQQQQQLSGADTDDFDDTASQSSDGSTSSSEVVLVQTEDGGTLAVQVEYLDEELYDRIFGAPDLQMAGSLPDLPNNQAGLKVLRERWLPPWRRPCTFFMEGSCRRKHCKFSHDLSSITCRFWQEGSCLKGSECPFLHGYPVLPRRRNRSEGDSREGNRGGGTATDGQQGSVLSQQLRREGGKQRHRLSSFELSSETDFPSLGTAADTKESERGGASAAAVGGGANTSIACQPSAQGTPQQPQQMRKRTKYTPITAAILQASTADPGSSGNKGRRRRHTHSAQRSRTPDGHHHASATAAAGAAPPSSLPDNGCLTTKGTLLIKPGTTLTGTASNGKCATVVPVKAKVRRNRSKVKEPARTVIAGASAPSTAEGGGGRVHGDLTVSDY